MAQLLPVEEFDLIIFGGTGDLAMRKLLPALYHRDRDSQITDDSRIIASSRTPMSRKAYLAEVKTSLQANSRSHGLYKILKYFKNFAKSTGKHLYLFLIKLIQS